MSSRRRTPDKFKREHCGEVVGKIVIYGENFVSVDNELVELASKGRVDEVMRFE